MSPVRAPGACPSPLRRLSLVAPVLLVVVLIVPAFVGLGGTGSLRVGNSPPTGDAPVVPASPVVAMSVTAFGNNSSGAYSVTFSETGLSNGTSWSVQLYNNVSFWEQNGIAGAEISFSLPNGSYQYNVSGPGEFYVPVPASGTVTVAGAPVPESIVFTHPGLYAVTFQETGLPQNSEWVGGLNVSGVGWVYANTTGQSVSIAVPNGTDGFSVFTDAWFYTASPSSGTVTVNGSAVSLNISFSSPPLFPLEFNETGLPNGTSWVVNIENVSNWVFANQTANQSLGFLVPNGTYSFIVIPEFANGRTYEPSPATGNVTVRGSAVYVAVEYGAPRLYDLYFNETGLAAGSYWYVWVYDASNASYFANSSTTSTLSFVLGTGAYSYTVYSDDRYNVAAPGSGSINVTDANLTVNVTFSHGDLPVLTITEFGLPTGTAWFVSVYSFATGYFDAVSNSSSTSFPLPNGTYSVQAQNVSSNASLALYVATPSTQNVTLTTSNVTLAVQYVFTPLFPVTFRESGLPPGVPWSVRVSSSTFETFGNGSFNDSATVYVPNGSYRYVAATSDPYYHAAPGEFTTNGTPTAVAVTFVLQTYSVSFLESGLPARTLERHGWTVELNGTLKWSASPAIVFTGLTNGTYEALVTGPSGYTATGSGPVNVSGTTIVTVSMSKGRTATLAFAERGLGTGSNWCISVDGAIRCSTASTLKFLNLTPASYTYGVVSPTEGQRITAEVGGIGIPTSGTLDLVSAATVRLTFTYGYAATFTESGLAGGTWSVTVRGSTESAPAGSPIVFNLTNGTYAYRVGSEMGYKVAGSPTRVTIQGGGADVVITFTPKGGAANAYSLAMEEVSSSGNGTSFQTVLALAPTAGLTTAMFGMKIGQPSGAIIPPEPVPSTCSAGALPNTCVAVSGGWYALLTSGFGTVVAAYGSSGWTDYTAGTSSVALNGADSLWILTTNPIAGSGDTLSVFGVGTASVSGSGVL